ncbi:MAG: Gfo/Idh/MocA family oxidoreductase [Candidatus Neomarinimicrobiota bacterium]|nr:Gfo/Idh/MocA family oxidoreductase [Candidatus Neomarinimicrobiota bacterium]
MRNNGKPQGILRRSFIGKSAKITAAGILLSRLPASSRRATSMEGEIKVALVGCGGRGTGAAAQALQADPDVRLVAMADVFQDQAKACYENLVEQFGDSGQLTSTPETIFIGFDAYKEAIDMADVVILTTPPGFRPLHFEYAVENNKQVFMEKPVATDVVGIKKILEVGKKAASRKLNVIVGLQRHYQRSYREVKKRLERNKIGRIISGQVYWNSGGVWVRPRKPEQTELKYQMRNWYYFNWICGDHIVEQHIHNIDVANWFIGDVPVSAQGMGGREVRKGPDHGHIFDHHFVEFTYPDGQVVASQCRHQRGCMNRVEEVFQGTRGTVHVHSGNYGLLTSDKGRILYNHEGEEDINPYQHEHNELFAAIKKGDYRYNDVGMGAESTMTAILGRMATYSGQVISWDEAMASDLDLVPELHSFNDRAPVLPDPEGNYPVPVPGKTKFEKVGR